MKTLLTFLITFNCITLSWSQDYYAVTVEDQNIIYNYPSEAIFELIDTNGVVQNINDEDNLRIKGAYTLQVEVPWSDEPEIINSNGGAIEFRKLTASDNKHDTEKVWDATKTLNLKDAEGKPVLIKKNVFLNKETNKMEAYFFFSNSMVFCYVNGVARAYEDNKKLAIKGRYLIQGKDDLLKLSYNPESGKMWYVFERLIK